MLICYSSAQKRWAAACHSTKLQ